MCGEATRQDALFSYLSPERPGGFMRGRVPAGGYRPDGCSDLRARESFPSATQPSSAFATPVTPHGRRLLRSRPTALIQSAFTLNASIELRPSGYVARMATFSGHFG